MAKQAEEKDYLHVQLPISTKKLLLRLRYEKSVSITEILDRVLKRAHKEAVLEDWIESGGDDSQQESAVG